MKISLCAANALFLVLVVFNNLTDYRSNYLFVENVLNMGTTFEGNSATWRAIDSPLVHTLFYWSIIAWEAAAAALLIYGTRLLFKERGATAAAFTRAKSCAAAGLVLSMLQWYIAFITVGGEWFLMWQSDTWNGQDAAMRMFLMMGVSLLFLMQTEAEA